MKLKEVDRTANVAWSPVESSAIYLAAGTAAQQLDSSFSSSAALELYFFDINQSGLDMPLNATLPCESRFHKLIWGSHGMSGNEYGEYPSGLIVAGCDGGVMQVYDAAKILNNEESIVLTKNKHTGPVRALDFNSFRPHIVASGASDSEIYIWDFNNPKTAMSTGTKSQPPDDVTHLAWNKQVEHILASTFSNRCVMWDLRKNEPIIKVADTTSRIRYKSVEWHPTVATQMCLASEDDSSPVIQLWDLRYATSPLKVLQGHQRGVLALSWCQQEPELLLSCGKDSNILCWNPNYPHPGYELIGEIPTTSQWSFDVAFCPRNPLIISSCSFEGRVSIFGLSGGAQQPVTSSKLADSFPGMDMNLGQAPVPAQKPAAFQLRDAPKWLKRPCGASFAFGGKLIKFENSKNPQGQGLPDQRIVTISQVVTLPDFLARSQKLEAALAANSLAEFCEEKASQTTDGNEAKIWQYLRASFSNNPTYEYLSMLGFNPSEVQSKLSLVIGARGDVTDKEVDSLTDGFISLAQGDSFGNQAASLDPQGGDGGSELDASPVGGQQLFQISVDGNAEGRLNQALLSGNIEFAVDLCILEKQWPEAFILAACAGPVVTKKVQDKYLNKEKSKTSEMIRIVVSQDWKRLVENCELDNWQQALATILTYVSNENDFSWLVGTLGSRLEKSEVEDLQKSAMICYICSGNMDRLADLWTKLGDARNCNNPNSLQDLVEQATILRKSAEARGRREALSSGPLAMKVVEYATLLASQGSLESALKYLADGTDPSMINLRERIQYALGYQYQRPRGMVSRSRQSSESSSTYHRGPSSLAQKRPSYTSNFSQPILQPPSAVPNGFPTSQQYNPSVPTQSPPQQQQQQQQPSSLPLPPVSSAAPGWNDPPSIALKTVSKQSKPLEAVEPITHPIFGSAPVSNPVDAMGGRSVLNPMAPNLSAPPKPVSAVAPSVPNLQGSGRSSLGAPPSSNPMGSAFASRAAPGGPPAGGAHAAPPPQLYNPASISAQSAPTPSYGGFPAAGPPNFAGYNPGPPPLAGGFPLAPAPNGGATGGAFAVGSHSLGGYTTGPPPSGGFTTGLMPSDRFTPGPPPTAGFNPGPPPTSGFTPGPPPTSGFTPGPPPTSGFAPGLPRPGGLAPGSSASTAFNSGSGNAFTRAAAPGRASELNPGAPTANYFTPTPPPQVGGGLPTGPPPVSSSQQKIPTGLPSAPPRPNEVPGSSFVGGVTGSNAPGGSSYPGGNFPPSSAFAVAGPPPSGGFIPGPSPSGGFTPANLLTSYNQTPSGPPLGTLPPTGGPGFGQGAGAPSTFNPMSGPSRPPLSTPVAPPSGLPPMIPLPSTTGDISQLGGRLSRPPSAQGLRGAGSLPPRPSSVQNVDSATLQQSPWDVVGGDGKVTTENATMHPPQTFSPARPSSGTLSPAPPILNPAVPSPSLPPPSRDVVKPTEPALEHEAAGAMPEEHKELVEVLEKLRSECYGVAGLPQIKRKLEDVARKLEIMRDKLRDRSLSGSTLTSLHNIVNALKNRDYQLALSIHTQLVSAGNFAEISTFLPSIKVLIQSAASLNVFL